jgi:hypothetical protein
VVWSPVKLYAVHPGATRRYGLPCCGCRSHRALAGFSPYSSRPRDKGIMWSSSRFCVAPQCWHWPPSWSKTYFLTSDDIRTRTMRVFRSIGIVLRATEEPRARRSTTSSRVERQEPRPRSGRGGARAPRIRGHSCATIPFHGLVVFPIAKLVADAPERESLLCCSAPPFEKQVGDRAARIQTNDGRVHLRHLHRLIATKPQRAERLVARLPGDDRF